MMNYSNYKKPAIIVIIIIGILIGLNGNVGKFVDSLAGEQETGPDLVLEQMIFSSDDLVENETVQVKLNTVNQGNLASTPFEVSLENTESYSDFRLYDSTLAPGETYSQNFYYTVPQDTPNQVTFTGEADSAHVVVELNNENNLLEKTLEIRHPREPNIETSHTPLHPSTEDNVQLEVSANDDSQIQRIDILLDGTTVETCESTEPSLTCTYDAGLLGTGEYVYKARAIDDDNNERWSSETEFFVSVIDNELPVISIEVLPSTPDTSETVTLRAEASDSDGELESVELRLNGDIVQTCESSPCTYDAGELSQGGYTFDATATDNASESADASTIEFDVDLPDDTIPDISVSHTPTGIDEYTSVTLNAEATDERTVEKIEVYLDGEIVETCEGSESSLSCEYLAGELSIGEHPFYAVATNDLNNSSTSSTVILDVLEAPNIPPEISIDHSPNDPDGDDGIVVTSDAFDENGEITQVRIFKNGVEVHTCDQNGKQVECNFGDEPLQCTEDRTYHAEARDDEGEWTESATLRLYEGEDGGLFPPVACPVS